MTGSNAAAPGPLERARVVLELVWVALGAALMAELALSSGWLGFGGAVASLAAWQLMVVVLLQNLVAFVSIVLFLRLESRSLRHLGFGRGRVAREAAVGLVLLPPAVAGALLLGTVLARAFPALHDVPVNPLLRLLEGPGAAAALLATGIIGGGIGEEIVRAFALSRFRTHLGGAGVGLVVWSLAFGAMHLSQGTDRALVVGMLGLLFGVVILWRGNPVAAMVLHAGFNTAQTVAAYLLRTS